MKKHRFEKKIRLLSLVMAFSLCFTTVFSLSVLTGYGLMVFAKKTKTAIVTSQIELNKALRDSAVNDIKIKSDEKDLKIRKGNYGGVKLTINAAKANIINNGSNFDGITIQNAGSFTENGDNNNVVSKDSRIKVTVKAASDNLKLVIAKKNSEVDITAAGSNTSLAITKPGNTTTLAVKESAASTLDYVDASDIRLCKTSSASGGASVSSVAVNAASTLIIKGSVREPIPVEMTANKAALKSSVRTNVSVYAKVDVIFKKGAEGSSVTTKKDGASAKVKNNTKGTVELIGKYGSAVMEPGDKGKVSDAIKDDAVSTNNVTTVTGNTVTGNTVTGNTVTGNSTGGGGSSGGGGGSSGGSSSGSGSNNNKTTPTPTPDPVVSGDDVVSGDKAVSGDEVVSGNTYESANKITPQTILASKNARQKTYIVMGNYDKGYYDDAKPLEWEVIGEDENGILVLSRKIICETSFTTLKMTLDGLYDSSCNFTDEDKAKIKEVTLDAGSSHEDTYHLFCLNRDEIQNLDRFKYTFGRTTGITDVFSQDLLAEGTVSAVSISYSGCFDTISQGYYDDILKGMFYTEDCIGKKYGTWCLRYAVEYYEGEEILNDDGYNLNIVDNHGMLTSDYPQTAMYGVRPAMYLDKDAEYNYVTYDIADPSYVKFGTYYTELDSDNYPITPSEANLEWEIIDKNENGFLLLSKNIINVNEYSSYESNHWSNSFVNMWLNDTEGIAGNFFLNTFDETERKKIVKTIVEDRQNPYTHVGGGGDLTPSFMFILDIEELTKYFGVNSVDKEKQAIYSQNLICEATPYAHRDNDKVYYGNMLTNTITSETYDSLYEGKGYTFECINKTGSQWFTRTAADDGKKICIVDCDGAIHYADYAGVDAETIYGVRPAIYVSTLNTPIG